MPLTRFPNYSVGITANQVKCWVTFRSVGASCRYIQNGRTEAHPSHWDAISHAQFHPYETAYPSWKCPSTETLSRWDEAQQCELADMNTRKLFRDQFVGRTEETGRFLSGLQRYVF